MNKILNPDQVFESFTKNRISKEEALNFLITILEKSENSKLRINSLRIIGTFSYKNQRIFNILENCLTSDETQEVRSLSSEIILNQYVQEGLETLKWAIMNEKSSQVLSHFNSILNKNNNSTLKNALDLRIKYIASNLNVKVEEVQFLLDLGIQISMDPLIEIYDQIYYISQENFICVIKNKHITEFSLSYYPKIPKSIGNLKFLETLYLSCNNFNELPTEFVKLINLKALDLSWNEFKELPNVVNNLHSLEELNLSNNFITELPEWISNLKNLNYLNLKGNNIKIIPSSIEYSNKIKFLH